ncbi:MAG: hypothetical protein K0U47_08650 [Epsilonproteobacteria bacterium]|nr:hypothetical protein [Campylobacterota bacterium]
MKNILYKVFIILIISIGFIACNSDDKHQTYNKVKIYKYDESIKCFSEGSSLNEMSLELIDLNITVYCAQKNYDGLNYTDECGENTGRINVYLIHKDNLNATRSLGFESIDQLGEYVDKDCD